jgi:hypothetical protein
MSQDDTHRTLKMSEVFGMIRKNNYIYDITTGIHSNELYQDQIGYNQAIDELDKFEIDIGALTKILHEVNHRLILNNTIAKIIALNANRWIVKRPERK